MRAARLNVLEVLKLLPRTNCRECGAPTCFAFANEVALGRRMATACPYIEGRVVEEIQEFAYVDNGPPNDDEQDKKLDELTRQVRQVDFTSVASRLGARVVEDGLAFRCLGIEFVIDKQGRLRSRCHANFWVLLPLLDTIVRADGATADRSITDRLSPEWVKVDELRNVISSSDFFTTTFEESLRKIAERDLQALTDVLEVFGGQLGDYGFGADLSVVIRPQPKVPLLLCYWKPEPGFESKLCIYFDRTAEEHLSIEGIYILMTGLVEMLKKICARHSSD